MKTYEEPDELNHSDTEITLGTRSILGIFFGLVLVCGVFFGFGYSLGRGNTNKAVAPAPTASPLVEAAAPADIKTVVEQPVSSRSHASGSNPYPDAADRPAAPGALPKPSPAASAVLEDTRTPQPAQAYAGTASRPQATQASYNLPSPAAAAPPDSSQPLASPAAIMVQIAAVSHREDADVLVAALGKLGYSASVRSDAADQLLHVQIGPFATRDEAKAMRTKLLNNGYNAILK